MSTPFEHTSTFSIPGLVSRVRRNHGLEHATLNILAQRLPGRSLSGHSDTKGFSVVGDIETQELVDAIDEALRRLNAGEENLAVHPNCGTNFVTAGVLAAAGALLGMINLGGKDEKPNTWERLPFSIMLSTMAVIAAQPLGHEIQANLTTDGRPNGLRVVEVIKQPRAGLTVHHVRTQG